MFICPYPSLSGLYLHLEYNSWKEHHCSKNLIIVCVVLHGNAILSHLELRGKGWKELNASALSAAHTWWFRLWFRLNVEIFHEILSVSHNTCYRSE